MPDPDVCLLAFLFVALLCGAWSILWARAGQGPGRVLWGRRLFIGTLLAVGGTSLVAAFHRAEGVIPLGFLAGILVVAMLWELPRPAWSEHAFPVPDEA